MSENEFDALLELILQCIQLIQKRFIKIKEPDDFVVSPEGVTMLDAITMRLQVIGESVKKIQKANPAILQYYSEIEWNKISRLRDLVSHHYEDVDNEIIFDICKNHIPQLELTVRKIINKP